MKPVYNLKSNILLGYVKKDALEINAVVSPYCRVQILNFKLII